MGCRVRDDRHRRFDARRGTAGWVGVTTATTRWRRPIPTSTPSSVCDHHDELRNDDQTDSDDDRRRRCAGVAGDAHLRLHLLSHRLAAPNTLNLDGIFGILNTAVWTDLPGRRRRGRGGSHAIARDGRILHVHGVDKFPRMVDYPVRRRIADASRASRCTPRRRNVVMHEGFATSTAARSDVDGRGTISAGSWSATVATSAEGPRSRGTCREAARSRSASANAVCSAPASASASASRRLRRGGRSLRDGGDAGDDDPMVKAGSSPPQRPRCSSRRSDRAGDRTPAHGQLGRSQRVAAHD